MRRLIAKRQTEKPPKKPDNPSFVTEQDRIVKLIEAIEASSQLCTITIDGSKKIFSTSLLDFQPEHGFLILDEISPTEGNAILQIVKSFKLSAFINGIHLSFKLNVIDHGLKKGVSYYKTAVPHRIYYPQRRKAPRIFVNGPNTIFFQAQPIKTGIPITGEVIDLSRTGLSVNII
ncbi:MAG: flagellar regulator YcgR PilZN domain-containing protein, partial [Gammaproteobacteria bacterium]